MAEFVTLLRILLKRQVNAESQHPESFIRLYKRLLN